MQPLMALSAILMIDGAGVAAEGFVPYVMGPMIGAVATVAIMRKQRAPFQNSKGLSEYFPAVFVSTMSLFRSAAYFIGSAS